MDLACRRLHWQVHKAGFLLVIFSVLTLRLLILASAYCTPNFLSNALHQRWIECGCLWRRSKLRHLTILSDLPLFVVRLLNFGRVKLRRWLGTLGGRGCLFAEQLLPQERLSVIVGGNHGLLQGEVFAKRDWLLQVVVWTGSIAGATLDDISGDLDGE